MPLALAACSAAPETTDEVTGSQELAWDSAENNPTHATHSYLTEHAIAVTRGELPEVDAYRDVLLRGANAELHELPLGDAALDALRLAIGGNNWACDRPDVLWSKAVARYEAGDRAGAYFHVGILLHYVEDMGVPAHAFHVVHQGNVTERDNFELLGLLTWDPDFGAVDRTDPSFPSPAGYMELSGAWARAHFEGTWPGRTYTRSFFSTTWLTASSTEKRFVRARQAMTATATAWALRNAARSFASLAGGPRDGVTVTVSDGFWGAWTSPAFCAPGSWVTGLRLRVERSQGRDDDTGLNAISLQCSPPSGAPHWITPHEGFWGDWGTGASCPTGVAVGAVVKLEKKQRDGDDTAANDVQLLCDGGGRASVSNGGSFGDWGSPVTCPSGTAACGAAVRMEPKQGDGDDTALNGLRLVCCPR